MSIYDKEQKGPITAISSVNGNLVATVGQKIYVFQFKDKDLFGMAFIDSQVYIHQLVTLKNFILVADIMKSVDLLQFQEDYRTLAVISRDPHPLEVYAVEYLVDNGSCAFAVTDADKNISLRFYNFVTNCEMLSCLKIPRPELPFVKKLYYKLHT